ncbi:TetR family transcriptional regulator [Vibrio sp. V27_P1S3P104]|uniref:TetR family transcriptional regulator n=1 Tax=Vibrio TaxID=662 RepID=UPI000C165392|nr:MULTISPECIES: TetR family transcriptional regulator [Vibrio]NAW69303.1 TetR family transcriptional regulator [Vibrio sp. V28_P6S34P95]NAX05648.1 TetR family transcriptional regulator [Vibrio sp. V30_P3S12P165]NAX33740.1 TetR family transcriptional regulator [Vibrio sp. V29_P1S30P107]NAX38369.1 TetR family transcriptional regulator [Vibrio sp. V27_P1S3P104]NAX41365.1 TetR family transcriptional regulator [Vibrio sp. V26_P1S5P106]
MPKRSKEDTEITIQIIMDAVIDQLLRLGYDKMSYTTLSQQTGVSRTGISHHFPKKTDFALALDGPIFNLLLQDLEFEQGSEAFTHSWLRALQESERFLSILRLIFHHVVAAERAETFSQLAIERLYKLAQEKFGAGSEQQVEWLLGKSLVVMSQ